MTDRNRAAVTPEAAALRADLSFRRAMRVLCLVLALGILAAAAGLASRTVMSRIIADRMESQLKNPGQANREKVDSIARKDAVDMLASLVRNDFTGFIDAYSRVQEEFLELFYEFESDSFVQTVLTSNRQDTMSVTRRQLITQAGSFWFVLEIAAYYREVIIAGAVLILLALLGIYMKGTRFSDLPRTGFWFFLAAGILLGAGVLAAARFIPLG